MTLQQYIKETGTLKLAHKLSMSPQAVSNWRNYETCPTPRVMKILIKLSDGRVSYAGIIEPYLKNRKRK